MLNVDEVIKQIRERAGDDTLPITVKHDDQGHYFSISYLSEWKTGGTEPVEDKDGKVTGYKENYETHKLTDGQRKKIDEYIKTVVNK